MRSALLPLLALTLATPSIASASGGQRDMERIADKLSDPRTQGAMAGSLAALVGALMDMRVDGIAKALEPLNRGRPIKTKGNTIREIAAHGDPRFEDKIEGGSRAMIGGLGAMAKAMAVMLPQLEEAMDKAGAEMDRAKDRLPNTN